MKLIGKKNNKNLPIQIIPDERIPKNKRKIGSANMIINQLPSLLASKQLSSSYKVVFSKGISGTLMELNSGLGKTTSIVDGSGKIVGQGGLQSLSSIATPMAIFSVMAMVTGQYFMVQMNNSLEEINKNLEGLKRQFDAKEEGNVFSALIFLQEIKNDWDLILSSSERKNGIISNIILKTNELSASCYYFQDRLNTKMTDFQNLLSKRKIAEECDFAEIKQITEFLKLSFELRNCLKMILVFLTTTITSNNKDAIKKSMEQGSDLFFSSTTKQLESKVDEIIELLINAQNSKLQNQAKNLNPLFKEIRALTREKMNTEIKTNIDSTIDKMVNLDENGGTFYIENGVLYIEEVA